MGAGAAIPGGGVVAVALMILLGLPQRRHFVRAAQVQVVRGFRRAQRREWHWHRPRTRAPARPRRAAGALTGVGASQVSVLAIGSSSVASYAATSSTGSSAVASVSTSVEDATGFTGGIAGYPQILISYGRILAPARKALDEDFSPLARNACLLLISVKSGIPACVAGAAPGLRWTPVFRRFGYRCAPMTPESRPTAAAPRLFRVPLRPAARP